MKPFREEQADPPDWPAWFDGRFLPARDVAVPARSPFALYGESVFTTIAAREGRLAFVGPHRARLRRGAEVALGAAAEAAVDELLEAAAELARRLADSGLAPEASLRVTLGRAVGSTWHRLVQARPLRRFAGSDAVRLRRAGGPGFDGGPGAFAAFKHGSRILLRAARRQALLAGAFDAVLEGADGLPLCGTVGNLVLLSDGGLATPAAAAGALPGIGRAALLAAGPLALGPDLAAALVERRIERVEWERPRGLWLCGSILGVAPVAALAGFGPRGFEDPIEVPPGPPGALNGLRTAFESAESASFESAW